MTNKLAVAKFIEACRLASNTEYYKRRNYPRTGSHNLWFHSMGRNMLALQSYGLHFTLCYYDVETRSYLVNCYNISNTTTLHRNTLLKQLEGEPCVFYFDAPNSLRHNHYEAYDKIVAGEYPLHPSMGELKRYRKQPKEQQYE